MARGCFCVLVVLHSGVQGSVETPGLFEGVLLLFAFPTLSQKSGTSLGGLETLEMDSAASDAGVAGANSCLAVSRAVVGSVLTEFRRPTLSSLNQVLL